MANGGHVHSHSRKYLVFSRYRFHLRLLLHFHFRSLEPDRRAQHHSLCKIAAIWLLADNESKLKLYILKSIQFSVGNYIFFVARLQKHR